MDAQAGAAPAAYEGLALLMLTTRVIRWHSLRTHSKASEPSFASYYRSSCLPILLGALTSCFHCKTEEDDLQAHEAGGGEIVR